MIRNFVPFELSEVAAVLVVRLLFFRGRAVEAVDADDGVLLPCVCACACFAVNGLCEDGFDGDADAVELGLLFAIDIVMVVVVVVVIGALYAIDIGMCDDGDGDNDPRLYVTEWRLTRIEVLCHRKPVAVCMYIVIYI